MLPPRVPGRPRRLPALLGGWQQRTLLIAVLALAGNQAVRPMVTYQALSLGATPVVLGVVAGSFSLFSSIVAAPLGRWVDRAGEPLVLLVGTVVLTISSLLLGLAASLFAVVLSHALLGLGQVACLVGMQTFMANAGDVEGRVARFGRLTVAASVGQMVGPAMSGLAYGRGMSLIAVFFLSAVPMVLAAAVALTLLRMPNSARRGASDPTVPRRSLAASARGIVGRRGVPESLLASLAVLASIDLLIAYLPAWAEVNAISPDQVGFLLGCRAAAGLASRVLMVRMLRFVSAPALLAWSMALPAVTLALLPTTTALPWLALLLLLAGFGLGLGQPLSLSAITDRVDPEDRGTALGIRITANRTAQLVLPVLAGPLAGVIGLGAVFVAAGGLLGVSVLAAVRGSRRGTPES